MNMIPLQMDVTALGALRLFGGLLGVGLLLLWTVSRARGRGEDPTVKWFKTTETGSASFLMSGSYAVAGVVVLVAIVLWPWLSQSLALAGILALVVVVHVWWEAKERD